jgi:Rha family phage regulatory protein
MTSLLVSPQISLVNGRPSVTSLQIAEHFGKRHDHVVRDIRRIISECPADFTAPNFGVSEYTDETGRVLPMFLVFRDGFMLLVMGYTGKKALQIKLAYIAAFNAMEAELAGKKALPETTTPSTAADRAPLRALVNAWARIANVHYSALWPQVKAHFQLERIDDLPVEWIPQALAWVQGKIDELQKLQQKALPEAESPRALPGPARSRADIDRLHMEMQVHMRKAADCGSQISRGMEARSKGMKYTNKHNVSCYLEHSFNSFADAWEAIAEAMKNNAKAMAYLDAISNSNFRKTLKKSFQF